MNTVLKIIMGNALASVLTATVFAQTNLQFTAVSATDEGNIQLTWSSKSNEVYEIDEADALIDTNTGSPAWNGLYDDYPSQGTNTFWLDTGNYNRAPPILNPKDMPLRFYRIVDEGPDDLIGDEPTVSIISPAGGAVASGLLTVTVTAATDQGAVYPKLYVDGQVMRASQDGSNYVINTCEWENGPHVVFATVDSLTQPDGPSNASGLIGHAVSPFVAVTFSNLVSETSFSQQSFQPSLGQTQEVSALFQVNCDWTLTIRDAFSNEVRTATGSGTSLQFGWDGTGDGAASIPDGIYYYYISAQPNGESPDVRPAGGGGTFSSSAGASVPGAEEASELWALPPGQANPLPLALYPPGADTNGFAIFAASPSEVRALTLAASATENSPRRLAGNSGGGSGFHPDDGSGGSGGASAQDSPPAPLRPPNPPCKGTVGKFGVAWQMYDANAPNPIYVAILNNNEPGGLGNYIQMEGHSGTTPQSVVPFKKVDDVALNFSDEMQNGCWDMGFWAHDDALRLSDLQGSGNPFNAVDIGLLICHGTYGTTPDYTTGRSLLGIYFPIAPPRRIKSFNGYAPAKPCFPSGIRPILAMKYPLTGGP